MQNVSFLKNILFFIFFENLQKLDFLDDFVLIFDEVFGFQFYLYSLPVAGCDAAVPGVTAPLDVFELEQEAAALAPPAACLFATSFCSCDFGNNCGTKLGCIESSENNFCF